MHKHSHSLTGAGDAGHVGRCTCAPRLRCSSAPCNCRFGLGLEPAPELLACGPEGGCPHRQSRHVHSWLGGSNGARSGSAVSTVRHRSRPTVPRAAAVGVLGNVRQLKSPPRSITSSLTAAATDFEVILTAAKSEKQRCPRSLLPLGGRSLLHPSARDLLNRRLMAARKHMKARPKVSTCGLWVCGCCAACTASQSWSWVHHDTVL